MIDHLGRRNLLMYGALGGSISMWIIGAYIKIADPENNPTDTVPPGGIAAIFFFYLWTAFYTPSWNGTPWVLNSEIFDQNTRSVSKIQLPTYPEAALLTHVIDLWDRHPQQQATGSGIS